MIIKLDDHVINTEEIALITPVKRIHLEYDVHKQDESPMLFHFEVVFRNGTKITIETKVLFKLSDLKGFVSSGGSIKERNELIEKFTEPLKEKATKKADFILSHMPRCEDIIFYDESVDYSLNQRYT